MYMCENDVKLIYYFNFPFSEDYEGALDEMGEICFHFHLAPGRTNTPGFNKEVFVQDPHRNVLPYNWKREFTQKPCQSFQNLH